MTLTIKQEEKWAELRDESKLGLKVMLQSINMIRDKKVITPTEKHQLNVLQIQINSLILFFNERSIVSKEEYYERTERAERAERR